MVAFIPLLRKTWIVLNGLLAAGALVVAFAELFPVPADGIGGAVFFVGLALLFALVGAGMLFRLRWLVILPAMPLFLSSLLFALAIALGAPIWGIRNAGTTSLLILGGLVVACIQFVGPFLIRSTRVDAGAPPEGNGR